MVGYRLNLFLVVLIVAVAAAGWALERDLSQPNYESIVEGQMARSPAYDSFAPNPNFADGMTLREPPAGSLPRGPKPLPYEATPKDAVRAGLELTNPFAETDEARLQRGRSVFANFCQVCHGPLGRGAGPVTQGGFPPPPSLMVDRSLNMPDGQMFHVLTYGQGNMPAIAPQLSPEDRWAAILRVRELQKSLGPQRVPVTREEVAILFRQRCSACHGEDGKGTAIRKYLPNLPDFTDQAWQTAQTELALVNQIDYGSQPLMPSFRYRLTRDQIIALAVYVRSLSSPRAEGTAPNTYLTPKEVYQTYCFGCHDSTGRGDLFWKKISNGALPNFTDPAWQKKRTDAELVRSIMGGKGEYMFPMASKLGTANVKDMVALVRKFGDPKEGGKYEIPPALPKGHGPPVPEKTETIKINIPKNGDKDKVVESPFVDDTGPRIQRASLLYRQNCLQCHGEDGQGDAFQRTNFPELPKFKDPLWQRSKEDVDLRISILQGKGKNMPAWGDNPVIAEQARDLVAYIRAFGPRREVETKRGQGTESEFERKIRLLQQQWDELDRQLQKARSQPGP